MDHMALGRTLRVPPLGAADPLWVSVLGILPLVSPARVGVHPDLREHAFLIFFGSLIIY